MSTTPPTNSPAPPQRLVSLDAFRGFTIVSMLWVNNMGTEEARLHQFGHAAWGEFPTFTDMIFPWFLFMMGCALPYARASRLNRGVSRREFFFGVLRRAFLLFVLGCIIDSSVSKRVVIGMDVLQLLGLSFLVASFIYELPRAARYTVAAVFLAAYWALLRFLPLPDAAAGTFTEQVNAIKIINTSLLAPWGLKGFLSIVPASALVIMGTWAGDLMRGDFTPTQRIQRLIVFGAIFTAIGLLWHLSIPMNKACWTPSYIVYMAGLACFMLALFYAVIDVAGWRKWAYVFVAFGLNPITAYFVSIMVRIHTVQEWAKLGADGKPLLNADGKPVTLWTSAINWFVEQFTALAGGNAQLGKVWGGWAFTLSYIAFWGLVMVWMHRRKIYWRV
ncbi:MAG: heparan-alpha-glucosaminide N-acetyltransferase domain-containing protein [Candidatus Sumerlaeaceae bacterium]|nr:heparan-alpha-glucosaminide N-acetyltransferase domain-containing protein [Candidatus Sumerlaeaceae bacterium]